MNPLKRGALIVIEGVDRSGKSTQCRKLVESLKSRDVNARLITFPDRTTNIGGIIDQYLKQSNNLSDEAIHLLFCANRWEKKQEMENLLKQGVTLIVDRYSFSGVVYSSVKKNIRKRWCQVPEEGLLKPDLVCLLTLNQTVMSQRPNYGDERYENKETQEKVAQAYKEMSVEQGWETVSADGNIEDIHGILLEKVLNKIKDVKSQPLQELRFEKEVT